jgi:hypothetical protein
MKIPRVAVALAIAAIPLVLAGTAPAGASLNGPCEATGTIKGVVYNPKTQDEVTIPRKDVVAWQGSVPGSGERNISGQVVVKMPPPFGEIPVGEWDGPSSLHSNKGNYTYDFPRVLVGLKVPVSGKHSEPGVSCSGVVVVELEGPGPASNPAFIGSLVLTLFSVVNVGLAMKAKRVTS